MMKRVEIYACLYVKEFPAQSLLRLLRELQNRARVVMEDDTHAPEPSRKGPFTVPSNESAISASEQSLTAVRQLRPPEAISVT